MEKISINLLPIELRDSSKKNTKQTKIIKISVGVLVFIIVLSLGVLSWTIIVKSSLNRANNNLADITEEIQSLKEKEGLVVLLKDRLDLITKVVQKESPQTQSFNLITSLQPADIEFSNFAVEKGGNIKLSAFTTSLPSLQTFFNNITDPKKNEGKISNSKVETLNKNQDGNYSFELTMKYEIK